MVLDGDEHEGEAVEKLDAVNGRDSHVQEHAEEDSERDVLEERRQQDREAQQHRHDQRREPENQGRWQSQLPVSDNVTHL